MAQRGDQRPRFAVARSRKAIMLESLQLAIILGVAVAVTGPKDLHRYARAAGKVAGRAVGYAKAVRGELDNVVDRAQVNEVHKELHETLSQLEAIRHEIRSGFSVLGGHRTVTREVYQPAQAPGAASPVAPTTPTPPPPPTPTPPPPSDTTKITTPGGADAARSSHPVAWNPAADQARRGVEFVGMEVRNSVAAKLPKVPVKQVDVIPVSAAAANRIPPRTGPTLGADIVLETVEEMNVAYQALEYLRQQEQAEKEEARVPKED